MTHVARTFTLIREGGSATPETVEDLEQFREQPAYVLRGGPGSGKTTEFRREAKRTEAHYISARDFIVSLRDEWRTSTIFIDGLDEMRVGLDDPRKPMDQIRGKLVQLGVPRFRISCRDGEWLGKNDRKALAALTGDSDVPVLRINPLGMEDIRKLLNAHLDPDRSQQLLNQPILQSLLGNPLTLRLLAKAFSGPDSPVSRTDAFTRACEQLARETSDEHQAATFGAINRSSVLRTAERICTILLLSGRTGCRRFGDPTDQDWLVLGEVDEMDPNLASLALRSSIFESPDADDRFLPVHRQIAEFLAARHLAHRVDEGLPVRRILSLVSGFDGKIVADFAGLTAWLAVLCKASRLEIIERNPLGVLFDGDIRGFSTVEKSTLIECVSATPWQWHDYDRIIANSDARLDDIATQDMVDVFRERLRSPVHDGASERAVLLITRSLGGSPAAEALVPDLLRIVRSDRWHPRIRYHSLSALVIPWMDSYRDAKALKSLSQDIANGTIPDEDDELLGLLLRSLYPSVLSAIDIVRLLKPPKDSTLYGAYASFWHRLPKVRLDLDEIGRVLDAIYAKKEEFNLESVDQTSVQDLIHRIPGSLLRQYLEAHQSVLDHARIYNWMELSADPYYGTRLADQCKIQEWVISHAEDFRRVVSHGLDRCAEMRQSGTDAEAFCRLLDELQAAPDQITKWLLEQSVDAKNPSISRALRQLSQRGVDPSYQFDKAAGREPSLEELGAALLADMNGLDLERASALSPALPAKTISTEPTVPERAQSAYVSPRLQALRDQIRQDLDVVASKQCPVAVLDRLARTYFGLSGSDEGQTPEDRLSELLADGSLVAAALEGLRCAVDRSDVPTPDEIADLVKKDLIHPLALPFLVGLAEIERRQGRPEALLDTDRLRTGLAFHFGTPFLDPQPNWTDDTEGPDPSTPLWYQRLLTSHAGVVAEVLIKMARAELSKGSVLFDALYRLETSADHQQVARLACPALLRSMPVRSNPEQMDGLACLLRSAIRNCDGDDLQGLIDSKIGRSSIHAGQRVYWLAAGLFCSPDRYRQKLVDSLRNRESLVRHVVNFFMGSPSVAPREPPLEGLDGNTVEALILLVGKLFEPPDFHNMRLRGPVLVQALIHHLSQDPSKEASGSLSRLSQSVELNRWRRPIQVAQGEQAAYRRTVSFRYVPTRQLLQTLENAEPASAADLAALTTDRMEAIAERIRHGNTSDWRQYWDWPKNRADAKPRHEELCRDALLSDLQPKLGRRIDAQPEGRYADDTRADIRVSYSAFNVPVEIKKSSHRDLWTAVRNQLLRKYARDPDCDGYGIYAVFWFGENGVQPPPHGTRPRDAQELRDALLDSLSPEELRKVSIVVIDVAKRPS